MRNKTPQGETTEQLKAHLAHMKKVAASAWNMPPGEAQGFQIRMEASKDGTEGD
jgi:hypothetical protein